MEALKASGEEPLPVTRADLGAGDDHLAALLASAVEVVWLAGLASPSAARNDPRLAEADVVLLRSILSLVRQRREPQPRVTLISSGGTVYDPRLSPPYGEDSPVAPVGPYGRSRVEMEEALRDVWIEGDCVVRVSNVYGPGQRIGTGQGIVAHWLDAARRGESLLLTSSPNTLRDFIFISDVARAFVLLREARERPDVINVGSGTATSLAELATLIQEVVGRDLVLDEVPDPGQDLSATWLDVDLARRALGWSPLVDLRSGITATWQARQ